MSDVQTEERPADGTAPVTETEETVVADATGDEATGGHAVDEAVGAEGAIEDAPAEAPVASETPAGPGPLEGLRAAVIAGCERLNQACQGADADFIRGQLEDLRARVATVRPAELTPRTGLGGLFDCRKKRLSRFRDHVTDLAVFDVKPDGSGLELVELADDVTLDEVRAKTEADFTVSEKVNSLA